MKLKSLLFLLALIFAVPAWSADEPTAPTSNLSTYISQGQNAQQTAAAQPKILLAMGTVNTKEAAQLSCPTGCSLQSCTGGSICAKNKPAPMCTAC